MRILHVEQNSGIDRDLAVFFRSKGVIADPVETAEDALELARHYDYDLILADTSLPDMDGIEFARRLRLARLDTPILMLSQNSRADARIRAFSAGVDDVVQKPCDKIELMARMQAITRRMKGFSGPSLRVGPLVLKQDSREVTVSGTEVKLTGKEYAILELLVLRKGTVLTKDAFLNHLYGGMDEPEAKIIDVFICKLRKKLAYAGAESLIGTVWGRGYMLKEPTPSAPAINRTAGSPTLDAVLTAA